MYDEEEFVCFNFCRGNSLENLQSLLQHIDALIFVNNIDASKSLN